MPVILLDAWSIILCIHLSSFSNGAAARRDLCLPGVRPLCIVRTLWSAPLYDYLSSYESQATALLTSNSWQIPKQSFIFLWKHTEWMHFNSKTEREFSCLSLVLRRGFQLWSSFVGSWKSDVMLFSRSWCAQNALTHNAQLIHEHVHLDHTSVCKHK